MIRQSGGFSILAHPHLIMSRPRDMSRSAYIDRLIDAGLQGIEAAYPYDKTSYRGTRTPLQIEQMVREDYGGRLFLSGGSDYHGGNKPGIRLGVGRGGLRVPLDVLEKLEAQRRAQGLPC